MSAFDKKPEKVSFYSDSHSRAAEQHRPVSATERGKTIYNNHDRFEWNSAYIKKSNLQQKRVQTNGLDPESLGDTVSLIKLEEEAVDQTGYNPYDSGLSAMKQSRKPPELHDLTRRNTQLRKFGK
jgi:hypothetical protein